MKNSGTNDVNDLLNLYDAQLPSEIHIHTVHKELNSLLYGNWRNE